MLIRWPFNFFIYSPPDHLCGFHAIPPFDQCLSCSARDYLNSVGETVAGLLKPLGIDVDIDVEHNGQRSKCAESEIKKKQREEAEEQKEKEKAPEETPPKTTDSKSSTKCDSKSPGRNWAFSSSTQIHVHNWICSVWPRIKSFGLSRSWSSLMTRMISPFLNLFYF